MEETDPCAFLDDKVPDAVVHRDLRNVLTESDGKIELDRGVIQVAPDCPLFIYSKALVCRRLEIDFGSCFSVAVAIGGIRSTEHGIMDPVYCFATLWYQLDVQLITVDFSATYSDS